MAKLSMDSIGRLLAGDGLSAVSKRARCSEAKTAKVLSLGIPTLIAGMQKNVSTPEGDASLRRALGDHGGKNTGDVTSFLKAVDLKDGKKILKHVFGDQQDATVEKLSKASGLSGSTVINILAQAAPLLLSLLGSQQSQEQSAVQQITTQPAQQQSSGLGGLLGGLLGGGSSQSGGGLNPASLLLGALTSGGGSSASAQPAQEEQSGSLLSGFLNLFR